MQAIEFESIVQNQAIPLPTPGVLSPGQPVRVVVMFEEKLVMEAQQARDDLITREPAHPVMKPDERLATLEPHPDALGGAVDASIPSPWDEAAWRDKRERA